VYLNLQQQVTQASPMEPWRGLSLFLNAAFADHETATQDSQIALGAAYTGLLDSRPHDEIALAIGRTHVNDRVKRGEELQNAAGLGPVNVQTSEYVAELYYGLQLTQWLMLRPNVQYVFQPGGSDKRTDDIILGLKAQLKI